MPKYLIKAKLVKVIPGHFEIEADSLNDAFILAEDYACIADMIVDENKFYEDVLIDKKNSKKIK